MTAVTLNHEFVVSRCHTDPERVLANWAVEVPGGTELTTLMGGLGLGFLARELLIHE